MKNFKYLSVNINQNSNMHNENKLKILLSTNIIMHNFYVVVYKATPVLQFYVTSFDVHMCNMFNY